MSRKTQPSVAVFERTIERSEWNTLEAAGKIILSVTQRASLSDAFFQHHAASEMIRLGSRPGEVRTVLKRLVEALEPARSQLTDLENPPSKQHLAALHEMNMAVKRQGTRVEQEAIRRTADHLFAISQIAKIALEALPESDSGTDADTALPGLLLVAHEIFVAAGGAGIYTDASVKFLHAVATIAGAKPQSAAAVQQTFKLARGRRSANSRAE